MKKALLALAVAGMINGQALAAVWYYDTSASPGLGGTPQLGNWASGAGGAMWSSTTAGTDPAVRSFSAAAGNEAWFDGTPATISITSGGVNVRSLTFNVNGYTISAAASPGQITLVSAGTGLTAGTIDVTNAGHTATISAPLQGTIGYIKTGAGTLSLTNVTAANHTVTGAVLVSGGTLQLATSASIGGATGDVTINGATLRNNVSTGSPTFLAGTRGIIIGASGGTIDVPGSAIQIYTSGSITGVGNTLTKSGTGTLRVTTPTSITFTRLAVTGGLYQAAADTIFGAVPGVATADAITLDGGGISSNGGFSFHANRGITIGAGGGTINAASSATVLSVITGAGALTKTGANILTLSGNNDYNGGTGLSVGRINFNHNNAAGTGTISVANASGIEFTSTAVGIVLGNNITLAGSGANAVKFYATSGNSLKLTGQISGVGEILRDDNGAGTLTLAGNSNFGGGVRITSRGIVIGHANGLGAGTLTLGDAVTAPANPITLSTETALTGGSAVPNAVYVNRDFSVVGSSDVEFSGGIDLTTGVRTATVSNSGATILSGTISNGGLTKAGAGELTLTGSNNYGGGTIINDGTVFANNTAGSATGVGGITVDTGGTLGGTGAVAGAVTVKSGGTLAPGASIESLDTGALTFEGGSDLNVEINSSVSLTAAADLLNSSGGLSIAATANLNLFDEATPDVVLANGVKLTLIKYDATAGWDGGAFAGKADDSMVTVGDNMFVINYNDATGGVNFVDYSAGALNSLFVTLTVAAAVPEASAVLFGGLACCMGGAAWGVRRRRARVTRQ